MLPPPTPKQARLIWLALTGLAAAVLIGLGVGLIWGLGRLLNILGPVLWPLAVAGALAYLLDPVVDYIEAKGAPRTRAILCVFAFAAVVLAGVFGSVVPQIVRETGRLMNNIPRYVKRVDTFIQRNVEDPPALVRWIMRHPSSTNAPPVVATDPDLDATDTNVVSLAITNPPSSDGPTHQVEAPAEDEAGKLDWFSLLDAGTLQTATGWIAQLLPRIGSWLFGQVSRVASWFGVLAGLALIPVYAFYFLLEKRGIERKWTDYLPVAKSGFKDELVFVLKSINNYLIVFFRSQVLVALCDGVLYTTGFLIIGLPYAFLLGFVATVLTMIPFLGAIVTCAAALILAFVQFGDWLHPLLVLVVFAIVQSLEGFVISPKIMGDRVGLHPLTIIIAVMAGTTLMGGLLGGILAIPFTAALRVLMFRYVWKRPSGPAPSPAAPSTAP